MDEMSEKFLNKFGVKDLGDIIENGNDGNEFLGRITSCNKVSLLIEIFKSNYYLTNTYIQVSNGVLLDEYQHNLSAANCASNKVENKNHEIKEEIEWIETQMHLRRSSF